MPTLKRFTVLAIVGAALPGLARLLCASSAAAQKKDGKRRPSFTPTKAFEQSGPPIPSFEVTRRES
jgi:hypothetical protein